MLPEIDLNDPENTKKLKAARVLSFKDSERDVVFTERREDGSGLKAPPLLEKLFSSAQLCLSGFITPIMARARLFHEFLLESCGDGGRVPNMFGEADSGALIFEMPLYLCLHVRNKLFFIIRGF